MKPAEIETRFIADARFTIPRRCEITLWCPAELAIAEAMAAVEKMPADVRLTDAVILLGQARDKVADYLDARAKGTE